MKMEKILRKFMTVTSISDEGITQMATVEGRAKYYDRVRAVRAEAHEILMPNPTAACDRALERVDKNLARCERALIKTASSDTPETKNHDR